MKRVWGRMMGLLIVLVSTVVLSGQLMAIPCLETKPKKVRCPHTTLKKQDCSAPDVDSCEQDVDIDVKRGKFACQPITINDPLTECVDGLGAITCTVTCRCAWSLLNMACESTDVCTSVTSQFKQKNKCPKGS